MALESDGADGGGQNLTDFHKSHSPLTARANRLAAPAASRREKKGLRRVG